MNLFEFVGCLIPFSSIRPALFLQFFLFLSKAHSKVLPFLLLILCFIYSLGIILTFMLLLQLDKSWEFAQALVCPILNCYQRESSCCYCQYIRTTKFYLLKFVVTTLANRVTCGAFSWSG